MADTLSLISIQRTAALSRVEEYFSAQGDFELQTTNSEIGKKFDGCEIWKGSVTSADQLWPIYIVFSSKFPIEPPIVFCPKAHSLYLENPHVLEGGYLCILSDSTSVDSSNVEDLLSHYLYSVRSILSGTSDADFREEFSSYWNRTVSATDKDCLIVSSPEVLKKTFHVFFGEKLILISDDEVSLNQWCSNLFEEERDFSLSQDGICLNIDSPLIPSEYPRNCFDLLELAKTRDKSGYELISEKLTNSIKPCLILLSQKTNTGFSLGCIEFTAPGLKWYSKLHKGFRKGYTPRNVLINRGIEILKETKVYRYKVKRTDYNWIHSRGGDGRNYVDKSVVLIGCGSLGGYIAHSLAKSGVGKLMLIDKEALEWANIGRHILGAQYIGLSKAEALKKNILKEMPHLKIEAHQANWLDLYESDNSFFEGYDAIVVSIAEWKYEKYLNHLVLKNKLPSVVFTWLEPYAVAGHSFLTSGNGCLNCHMNTLGQFLHAVSEFGDGALKREPGGCTFYQPYGPVALLNTVAMTCKLLLKHLLNPIDSYLLTWISDEDHFRDVNSKINSEWSGLIAEKGYSRLYQRNLKNYNCEICTK